MSILLFLKSVALILIEFYGTKKIIDALLK